ncbi:MAG: bifunctional oligoribonuclease/PAP phosphatase NrnA [Ruminiclostridium sp.]|nr:bifunctional oligoribonuclease/PAP phosphatase NrnA [Ruminiclostridium sp.]
MVLDKIVSALNNSRKIAILPHISADGDALGSSLALALALAQLGKSVKVILEEDIPQVYNFLPGRHMSEVYALKETSYDTVVALDTGDTDRLGKRLEIFRCANVTINIDHHNTNSGFAFHNYVSTDSSAVGEIIFSLVKMMGVNPDQDISTCLYVAIITDTGGFRYSNTTPLTHRTAAELIENGINVAGISQLVFDSTSYEKVRLLGSAIQALELLENGKVALISLTDDMLRSTGAKEEECDGIVNIGRNIRGVEVAAMLRQWENGEIKVNLRSSSKVDVSAIASSYGGGGHKKAAGYITKAGLDAAKKKLLDDIREVL